MKIIKQLCITLIFLLSSNALFATANNGENLWKISTQIADDAEIINSKICFIDQDLTNFTINASFDLEQFEQTLCSKIDSLQESIFITQEDISTTGFTISTPGSYCLAETVIHTNASNPAITINTNNVTLNLNDHHIICTGGNSGISATAKSNIVIKNGVISSAITTGIFIDNSSRICIKNVKIFSCGDIGFNLNADESLIEHCVAINNDHGIKLDSTENTCIRDCVSSNNTVSGYHITTGVNNIIVDSVALFNGTDGFLIATGGTRNIIYNCIASENQDDGIDASSASNTCIESCKIIGNAQIGIRGDGSTTRVFNTLAQGNTTNFLSIDGPIETIVDFDTRYWSNVSL
jgi:hypothetical protein